MTARGKRPEYCYDCPHPAVTVDIAVFREREGRLEVLLIRRGHDPFKGRWALPGGFVDQDESLERAASRELMEETGLKRLSLVQVGAFGDPGRDPRGHTVTIAFAGLLDRHRQVQAGDDAADARWWPVTRPPRLAFDHRRILATAIRRLFD